MRIPLLLAVVCLPALCADQVVLKNGDILTGAIVKKDGDKLTLRSEFLGDVSMPWTAVQSIKSDQNLTVVLPSGETVAGTVATADGRITVSGRSTPLAEIAALRNPAEQAAWERLQDPGMFQLWAGYFDLGLALARGNARTDTLTTAGTATRVTRKDKITLNYRQIRGSARIDGVTEDIASAIRGGWLYNRDVSSRLFVGGFNDYEYDRFQDLDLRFVLGGSFGAHLIKTEKAVLSILGGGGYQRESFSTGLRRNSGELHFGDDFVYRFTSASSVTQSFRIFPNLSDRGDYRVNFDLSAVTTLRRWLGWHVTISDRFLTNPLPTRQRNDILLSTGFRVSFAR